MQGFVTRWDEVGLVEFEGHSVELLVVVGVTESDDVVFEVEGGVLGKGEGQTEGLFVLWLDDTPDIPSPEHLIFYLPLLHSLFPNHLPPLIL